MSIKCRKVSKRRGFIVLVYPHTPRESVSPVCKIFKLEFNRSLVLPEFAIPQILNARLCMDIWGKMWRKNSDKIYVLFSPSLLLQSALLCHPGSLELVCSWTIPGVTPGHQFGQIKMSH